MVINCVKAGYSVQQNIISDSKGDGETKSVIGSQGQKVYNCLPTACSKISSLGAMSDSTRK